VRRAGEYCFMMPGGALGADDALVQRVVGVALDVAHLAVAQGDADAAAAGAHVAGGVLDLDAAVPGVAPAATVLELRNIS
jgi:hypothetical protein